MNSKVLFAGFSLIILMDAGIRRVELIKLPDLKKIIESKESAVTVINFWATWCGPCVKEMPLFEKLNADSANVKVVLVSMDLDLDPDPEKVRKFVGQKKLTSLVYILDEKNPNEWIHQIDESWTGALPATLIVNSKTGKRKFIERELHASELEKLITDIR